LWTSVAGPFMETITLATTHWQGPAVSGGRLYLRTDRLRVYGLSST
jgi:hypothetical protein